MTLPDRLANIPTGDGELDTLKITEWSRWSPLSEVRWWADCPTSVRDGDLDPERQGRLTAIVIMKKLSFVYHEDLVREQQLADDPLSPVCDALIMQKIAAYHAFLIADLSYAKLSTIAAVASTSRRGTGLSWRWPP